MTEQEVTECVAIAQCVVEAVAQSPEYALEMIGFHDYAPHTEAFLRQYFLGLLDIIRGTE